MSKTADDKLRAARAFADKFFDQNPHLLNDRQMALHMYWMLKRLCIDRGIPHTLNSLRKPKTERAKQCRTIGKRAKGVATKPSTQI